MPEMGPPTFENQGFSTVKWRCGKLWEMKVPSLSFPFTFLIEFFFLKNCHVINFLNSCKVPVKTMLYSQHYSF